jgi:hypothetical protein
VKCAGLSEGHTGNPCRLQRRLSHFARIADQTDASIQKGELRGRIWEFCSEDWRTAEEVAGFVQRRKDYVVRFMNQQMQDCIETLYKVPHHPRQKYRTRKNRQ